METDRDTTDKPTTVRTFKGALHLSVLVGAVLGGILLLFARPLVRALIGNDSIDLDVLGAATRYVRIRALGMPAAAVIGTAQAACLGMQDVKSPLYVIFIAALANLVGDLCFVGRPHTWIGGAAGAAWATIISQYVAMSLFLKWLSTKPRAQSEGPHRAALFGLGRTDQRRSERSTSTRGLLEGKLKALEFLSIPSNETRSDFQPYVIPVTTTQVGRCSTYVAMGHVVSSSFGTVSMAANQFITSIFYALIPIADSLSLTAQSFLPPIVARKPSPERANAIRVTTMNLLKVAGLFGFVLAGIFACIPLASQLFTTDLAVTALVRRIVPVLFIIFSLHGIFCGSEGILLGQRDLTFLGRMYAIYFAVVPFLMLQIKRAARIGAQVDLLSVLKLFLYYQLFRISAWVGRLAWLQRKSDVEARSA